MTAFDQFWARYPRRVARKDAQKAWAQVNADKALDAILDALAWQTTQPAWTKDDGAFVPYPATWLRGERWTDENPAEAQRAREEAARMEARERAAERERRYEEWEARKRAAS